MEHTVHVLKGAGPVQFTVLELDFVVKSWLGHPFVVALSRKLSVFKLTLVIISVMKVQNARTVENIGQKLSFINILFGFICLPSHFPFTLHLTVDEFSNIVSTIWPLELSISLDLRVTKVASINEYFFSSLLFIREVGLLIIPDLLPFFKTFTIYIISAIEKSADFDLPVV